MGDAIALSLIEVVQIVIQILYYLLIARAIISWFSPSPYNPIVQFLYIVTEPMLKPIRRVLPRTGRFDLSPLVAILLLVLIRSTLIRYAHSAF